MTSFVQTIEASREKLRVTNSRLCEVAGVSRERWSKAKGGSLELNAEECAALVLAVDKLTEERAKLRARAKLQLASLSEMEALS